MTQTEFEQNMTIIHQKAETAYLATIKPIPTIEFNMHCCIISKSTGIDFDTVRYLIKETMRQRLKGETTC